MDSQLNNYTLSSADNKGILSLLTAIEQSGDCNYDASEETSPSKIMDKAGIYKVIYKKSMDENLIAVSGLKQKRKGRLGIKGLSAK